MFAQDGRDRKYFVVKSIYELAINCSILHPAFIIGTISNQLCDIATSYLID